MDLTRKNSIAERIHLNSGGYDMFGRYYGTGRPLYRLVPRSACMWFAAHGLTARATGELYFRAEDARDAREIASRAYHVMGAE